MNDSVSRRLGDYTWTQFAGGSGAGATRDAPILVVPIGSCEQHGPHLPLDTDTRIALAIADRMATADERLLVAPPLTISASGEHQGFPGTLSIGAHVTELVVVELGRSADWASGIVLVNGHGGNVKAVETAVATLTSEGRRVLSWWPRVSGGDAHAGRTETSLMLAIAPERVRLDAIAAGNVTPLADLLDALTIGGVAAVSRNGVLGDPTGASAAEGDRLLGALAADALARIESWQTSATR